jgi:hypothetical protein
MLDATAAFIAARIGVFSVVRDDLVVMESRSWAESTAMKVVGDA